MANSLLALILIPAISALPLTQSSVSHTDEPVITNLLDASAPADWTSFGNLTDPDDRLAYARSLHRGPIQTETVPSPEPTPVPDVEPPWDRLQAAKDLHRWQGSDHPDVVKPMSEQELADALGLNVSNVNVSRPAWWRERFLRLRPGCDRGLSAGLVATPEFCSNITNESNWRNYTWKSWWSVNIKPLLLEWAENIVGNSTNSTLSGAERQRAVAKLAQVLEQAMNNQALVQESFVSLPSINQAEKPSEQDNNIPSKIPTSTNSAAQLLAGANALESRPRSSSISAGVDVHIMH